jgi:hypothetical protein
VVTGQVSHGCLDIPELGQITRDLNVQRGRGGLHKLRVNLTGGVDQTYLYYRHEDSSCIPFYYCRLQVEHENGRVRTAAHVGAAISTACRKSSANRFNMKASAIYQNRTTDSTYFFASIVPVPEA